MSEAPKQASSPKPEAPREMTRLESDDEIRQALLARRAARKRPEPGATPVGADIDPLPFRPQQRPSMALLGILDDGQEEGEWVRLRGERCVIGRSEGDIRIPHDGMMSARHAEISRQSVQGVYRWTLTDLQSTNGTYVRIGKTLLKHGHELRIGRTHFRFEAAQTVPEGDGAAAGGPSRESTVSWHETPVRNLVATLVEIPRSGTGQRFPLTLAEYRIGRDRETCAIALADDPFANASHARLYRDAKGLWHAESNKARNGLWLRIDEIPLTSTCQFQLGEQRFILRVLS